MSHRIQLRRDKAAFWAQADPVLAQGELAWSTDTGELKIGDGETAWSELSNILNPGEPSDSTNIAIYDTASDLWDDPEFGNFNDGQLFLIRDFSSEQQNAGGALLRMVNDGLSEPDTETVLIGIASAEGQFRAVSWLIDDTSNMPEYTLASSVSTSVSLPTGQVRIQDESGDIKIYFSSDTDLEQSIGRYSKSDHLFIALNDLSKAAIIRLGGSTGGLGVKNYSVTISSNEGSVMQAPGLPLLDIEDILNGVHDLDTFIIGNAAKSNSLAVFEQESKAELQVSGTLQPVQGNGATTDPGNGYIAFDSLNLQEVTRICISKASNEGQAILDWILGESDVYGSTASPDRVLILDFPDENTESFMLWLGDSGSDQGDYVEFDVAYIGNSNGDDLHTLQADETVEIYMLHTPYKEVVDLSQFVTEAQVMELIAPFTQNPISLGTPIGVQSEITHTGTGYETISQVGFIREEFVGAVNFGAQMVLEISLNYYVKPNGTQPLVRLKLGNIEVKLPSGNIPGTDSFLYFEGTVTLFISKPGADLQIKALTRFRSYETFAGGDLQDDLVHFPGDYLGNDDYTVTGNWVVDGSFTETNPTLQFDADSGIKARLEKASGQVSLAM
ncbi:hyaluronate lyase N-terminal domain-containing protein [Algoriphagus formosus]|uniref:hyaluronate lyase N-terminal domain-containing protein n=1 Tax=Algoriphagus formosus TaxID=2007308 RepID=UPI000C281E7E|nr:hypothetical protein [Algoriphagus formosus]